MVGVHHVEVSNRDAKFKFDLYRNVTVVRGDSGTGKTTLYAMIADYTRLKSASGVNISCDKECVALTDMDWVHQLQSVSDSIVFIDEGFEALKTTAFASAIIDSDNYYVIFCRDNMHNIPYSVEEIYEIKRSGKYHSFKKMYKANSKHLYVGNKSGEMDILLTEDSKAGYEFFEKYMEDKAGSCVAAGSNSAIFSWVTNNKGKRVFVVADGAAFGSEMDRVVKLQNSGYSISLCLPESFEWLILKSGILRNATIDEVLANPSEYIECGKYFSWERFFTDFLIQNTAGTPFQYSKGKINPVYLTPANMELVINEIV